MNRVKSFEEMGREADKAGRDLQNCRATLAAINAEQAKSLISITLNGANWDNGLLALQEKLQKVVREQGEELIFAAFESLADQSKGATAALRAAFDAGQTPPVGERLVPREPLVLDREVFLGLPAETPGAADPAITTHAPDTRAPADATREAPLLGQSQSLQASGENPQLVAWNALPPQARELLQWVQVNPSSRFARTPARDLLASKGYLVSLGSGANASWNLTAEGLAILPVNSAG